MKLINQITPIEEDFSKWYTDVIINGNLIEYGPIKGTMIFKPNSYGIWENITKELNEIIKNKGAQNVYLPLFIPKNLISKEKDHVNGFAPELATITKVGDKKLSEDIYIRPTSEVLFAQLFKSEINSYNDLPKIYNQWSNVVRWETTTNPFLRSTEFLWQEGHTSHSNAEEAIQFTEDMIKIYQQFYKDYLALDVICGKKTEKEKFAGADTTWTIEAMMKDGRALQAATSHYLSQNFSKMFDVSFKDQSNKLVNVYQTSWGLSTRSIGAIIMGHGDNRGIVIPPKIAPIKVIIIEVLANKNKKVKEISNQISNLLQNNNISSKIDDSNKSVGFKASQSEIEGIPIRIEIGPKEIEENKVLVIRRDTLEKYSIQISDILEFINNLLQEIHTNLYNNSKQRLKENLVYCNSYDEFKELIKQQKFVVVPIVSDSFKWEEKIKEETFATSRCILLSNIFDIKEDKCMMTNKVTKNFVLFAKSY